MLSLRLASYSDVAAVIALYQWAVTNMDDMKIRQ